jgi:Mg2+/citrate symporter
MIKNYKGDDVIMVEVQKPWYKSKTVWMNAVLTLVAMIELLKGLPWVSPEILVFVAGVLNVVLRVWFTSSKVTL